MGDSIECSNEKADELLNEFDNLTGLDHKILLEFSIIFSEFICADDELSWDRCANEILNYLESKSNDFICKNPQVYDALINASKKALGLMFFRERSEKFLESTKITMMYINDIIESYSNFSLSEVGIISPLEENDSEIIQGFSHFSQSAWGEL